jgi:CheY-like chemotaxis protein
MTVSILVVDDEPDVVSLYEQRFRRELRNKDCVLQFAGTGAEALKQLEAAPDTTRSLVLMDIKMPDISGLDLMVEVKRRWPDLPAFMVTAFGDDENRHLAAEAGADEFVTKPIDFGDLKSHIRKYRPWPGLPT